MLKAKPLSKRKKISSAMLKHLHKDDDRKAVYVKISAKHFKKLHMELAQIDMKMWEWVEEKIDEI